MEISESDRDAYLDLLYGMYDADLVDVVYMRYGEIGRRSSCTHWWGRNPV